MTRDDTSPATPQPEASAFHDPLAKGFSTTREGRALFWLAVVFSVFQIVTALHLVALPSIMVHGFHVGFLLALTFR